MEEIKRKAGDLALVTVVFPRGGGERTYLWECTYLAPKEHGLRLGDKVVTPTGPAHVVSLTGANDPNITYKRLLGKYVAVDFKY